MTTDYTGPERRHVDRGPPSGTERRQRHSFEKAFAIVVGTEGGFTANPVDSGNWTGGKCQVGECKGTKFGVSAAAYPNLDIEALTLEAAHDIYKQDYWDHVFGDHLPPPLALLVFDSAVNSGAATAVRWLQTVLDVSPVDGILGAATLAALSATVASSGGAAVCAEYLALRLYQMSRMPGWTAFGRGWSRRICRLPYQSLTMEG